MLDLNVLDQASKAYQETLTTTAQKCSDEIKRIVAKFKELDVPSTYHHWREDQGSEDYPISVCLYYDKAIGKIMYWVDDPDNSDFLAGSSREIRASMLPRLRCLVEEAVNNLDDESNKLINEVI
jgi:hypothetical protein